MLAFVVLKQPELAAVPLMYGLLMNIPACIFVWWANRSATIETKEQIT
jgi:BASS family bile acid:Na+ symporter